MSWFKLDDSFLRNRKPMRLAAELGCSLIEARGLAVTLWTFCLTNAQDGDLSDYSDDDMNLFFAAESFNPLCPQMSTDSPRTSVDKSGQNSTIRDVYGKMKIAGLIDENNVVHNWNKRNGSWKQTEYKRAQRQQKQEVKTVHGLSTNVHGRPQNVHLEIEKENINNTSINEKTSKNDEQIIEVLDFYKKTFPKSRARKKGSKDWSKVNARLDDGFSADELKQAIANNSKSRYHIDGNYHSIELIMRDAGKVEYFVGLSAKKGNGNDEEVEWLGVISWTDRAKNLRDDNQDTYHEVLEQLGYDRVAPDKLGELKAKTVLGRYWANRANEGQQ